MENLVNIPIPPIIIGVVLVGILVVCLFLNNKKKDEQMNSPKELQKTETIQESTLGNNEITPDILAVITAAVASVISNPYQIKTIKRIDNNQNWKMSNRFEQTHNKI